jgi:hypothetical protein
MGEEEVMDVKGGLYQVRLQPVKSMWICMNMSEYSILSNNVTKYISLYCRFRELCWAYEASVDNS